MEDQELTSGNRALFNGINARNEIRVFVKTKEPSKYREYGICGTSTQFVYVGLYHCTKFKKVSGKKGKCVFKFCMRRIAGQAQLELFRKLEPCTFLGSKRQLAPEDWQRYERQMKRRLAIKAGPEEESEDGEEEEQEEQGEMRIAIKAEPEEESEDGEEEKTICLGEEQMEQEEEDTPSPLQRRRT